MVEPYYEFKGLAAFIRHLSLKTAHADFNKAIRQEGSADTEYYHFKYEILIDGQHMTDDPAKDYACTRYYAQIGVFDKDENDYGLEEALQYIGAFYYRDVGGKPYFHSVTWKHDWNYFSSRALEQHKDEMKIGAFMNDVIGRFLRAIDNNDEALLDIMMESNALGLDVFNEAEVLRNALRLDVQMTLEALDHPA